MTSNTKSQPASEYMICRGGHRLSMTELTRMYADMIARLPLLEGEYLSKVEALCEEDEDPNVAAVDLAVVLQHQRSRKLRELGRRALDALATAGNNNARFNLAITYLKGGQPKNYARAFELMTAVAHSETRDPFLKGLAVDGIGECYLKGRGVPADFEKAIHLFEQAAEYGVPEAAFSVGLYHDHKTYNVHPGRVDYPKAALFYKRAMHLGSVKGMTNLGILYVGGHVRPPTPNFGWELLKRASVMGDTVATDVMARFIASGRKPEGGLPSLANHEA